MAGRVDTVQMDADRAMLVDFIHHDDADCDAAAYRLAASPREDDRRVAREWRAVRSVQCVRVEAPAATT